MGISNPPILTYDEALEMYNNFAAASGLELKKHGDIITLNELYEIAKPVYATLGILVDNYKYVYGDYYGWAPLINNKESLI